MKNLLAVRNLTFAMAVVLSLTWMAHAFDPNVDPLGIDHPMFVDPYLPPLDRYLEFPPGYLTLWLPALKRPEADYRRRAAEAIGRAHELGMPRMAEAAPELLSLLASRDEHRLVRMAAARALHQLDGDQAAPILLEDIRGNDYDMVLVADAALAHWKYDAAAEVWMRRLEDLSAPRAIVVSAIESLAIAQITHAASALVEIAIDRSVEKALRLSAARAVAALQSSDLEADATQMQNGTLPDRLVAATLISTHQSETAQQLILNMSVDPDPAVAAIALRRLLEIDPLLITPLSAQLIVHPDPNVRQLTAQSLVSQASTQAVTLLGPRLDDVNPDLRLFVRNNLIQLSKRSDLTQSVLEQAVGMLSGDRWRGLEQAAIVLGRLDHESVSKRLLQLMRFNRHEVRVAAVAALRWLEMPEHLPTILERAEEMTNAWKAQRRDLLEQHDQELAQLNQIFGVMNYKQAEKLMERFIPKHSFGHYARAAAVWDLGHFFADQPENPYPERLAQRLADNNPFDPELPFVRRQCAIALARMRASSQLQVLRLFYDLEDRSVDVGSSTRWAIMYITGEELPPQDPLRKGLPQFFLEPVPQ